MEAYLSSIFPKSSKTLNTHHSVVEQTKVQETIEIDKVDSVQRL